MIAENSDADLIVLQARQDMLKCLLRGKNVLISVYPYLLLLSLKLKAAEGSSANSFCVTNSISSSLALLGESEEPVYLLISEYLIDGSGLDLIQHVKSCSTDHKCILILTHNHRVFVQQAMRVGANGVVLESSIGRTGALIYAVEQSLKGFNFVDPAFEVERNKQFAMQPEELTLRETEILQLVAEGLSNSEIGERLNIAVSTARDHVHEILRRLGVKNRAAAAVEGLRQGYCR
ncbi:MAG: response regulator transcription factor [Synechococcus lacustris]|uniref:response regulator transcription factor n=1 Tax=Synechococcus sp. UW140 TaxID=368503 RepID=UPI0031378EB2|nr:response regulator transcription factor [Synechococcus lacustris]